MVWEFLFQKVALVVGSLLALIPGADLVDFGGLAPAFAAMHKFDDIIPISETLNIAASYVGFLSVVFVFISARAVLRFIPVFGVKG